MLIAIKSDNEDIAGAIVYWRLSGDINGDDLNNALSDVGLEQHHVSLPGPRRALRRAMQEFATGEVFLRAGKQGDGGLYLVRQVPGEDGPEFKVWVEARLSTAGVPTFECRDFSDITFPEANDIAEQLTSRFWHHVFHLEAADVSSWLIDQARECDALSLRDSGGVYFIPRHKVDAWGLRVDILSTETNCQVYMIPALHSDDAVGAVMQALVDECTTFTKQMQDDIASECLGVRALQNKATRAKSLLSKLTRYEDLLGTKLTEVRDQIVEQETNAIQAALSAGGDDE